MTSTTVFLYDSTSATNYEITSEVASVEVTRGRSRDLDEIGPGTARIRCHNLSGNFNPYFLTDVNYLLLESGDFILLEDGGRLILDSAVATGGDYGVVTLGRKLTVLDGATTVFTGFVEDFEFEWAHGNIAAVTIIAADGLARLARQRFLEWTTNAQSSGDRMTAIFARPEVDSLWATLLFDVGLSTLQSDLVTYGSNVLNYCQEVNRAEQGRFYVSGFGTLVFQDRQSVGAGTAVCNFTDSSSYLNGQTAGKIPFSAVGVTFGSELLYTKVSVDIIDGDAQTADDATAQANYGIRHLVMSNMLNDTEDEALDMANYLLDRYSTPEAVVSSIRVPLHKLSSANRTTVAGIEISDTATLDWTPTPGFSAVSETLVVEGVDYQSDMKAAAWMTYQLSAAPDNDFFILDNDSDNYSGASILDNDTDTQANAGILGF